MYKWKEQDSTFDFTIKDFSIIGNEMVKFCSINVVKKGDWLLKASSFDDQILIIGYKKNLVDFFTAMFYDEETAHLFVEKLND